MKGRRLFSFILACMLLASIIFGGTDVSAKTNKSLKVTYKGKTVTLIKDKGKQVSIKSVQKAWGRCKTANDYNWKTYTWKTKKTKISINDNRSAGKVGGISISIEDKNGSIAGVKVGMTKAQALKKLRKTYGSSHVKIQRNFIVLEGFGMCTFTVKSGKIVKISYFSS